MAKRAITRAWSRSGLAVLTGLEFFLVCSAAPRVATAATTITLNGSQTYQTIDGFGVNANHRNWNNDELKPVLDTLIDQGGMTLFRVLYDNTDWEATNDNSDPAVMNWSYYNTVYSSAEFQKMWGLIGYLNQRGLSNGVSMNFQGAGPAWLGGSYLTSGYEAEWAEMMASLVIYARTNQHLQFSLFNPANEPDLTPGARTQGVIMNSSQYVAAMHQLAQLLDAYGITDLRFVGPDLAFASTTWMNAMMGDATLMSRLAHFGVHSYQDGGGGSSGIYSYLQSSPYPDRGFWMTEFNAWCSNCENCVGGDNSWSFARSTASYLYYHLANGASAGIVWEGYDSYFALSGCWSYWGLIAVDNINAASKTYTPRKGFYTISQFSRFVRPGAKRIAFTGSLSPLLVLAFSQASTGQVTLVGINPVSNAATFSGTLASLPAISSFDLYYTSSSANLSHSATFPVTNNIFSATVPADCVFTLVGAAPTLSVTLLSPTNNASYNAPATIPLQAEATTPTGSITQVTFFNGATNLGSVSTPPYTLTWSNVPPGAYTLTAAASNSLGNAAVSPAVHISVVGPLAQITVTPTNALLPILAAQQFTATAADALGTPLTPQPLLSWSASGGGTINATGLFTAGNSPGGPFTIQASSGSITGLAQLTITATPTNLAPQGTAYSWYSLSSATANTPRVAAPGLNDSNLTTSLYLLPGNGSTTDVANAYEAAGIVWPTTQTIGSVIYYSGAYDSLGNGVFDAGFRLQFSLDGATWNDAGPGWSLSPPYRYDSPLSANTNFTFSGSATNVRGVRCLGQVHTGATATNSWMATAREVQAFSPAPCTFALSSAQASFSAAAGQGSFSVTAAFADCSWTAGSTNEWIHPTASTNAGPGEVAFLVDTNASIVPRVGYIQVADQTFTVLQAAAPCAFSLSLAETNISAAALSASFSIVASFPGCSWIASTTNDWLHVALTNNGSSDVAFVVDTNASIVARLGYIQVADQTFTVSQAAAPCTFALSLAATNISAAEMLASFSIVASFPGCSWIASTTNDWLHVALTNNGSSDVAFVVDTNASIVARLGYIQVADQTFTVSQAAAPCAFALSLAETNISAAAGQGSFSVTAAFADCSWTAGSTNEWIHATASTNAGPGDVLFLVDTNASIVPRLGYIQVADQTFTVSQAAAPCAFALSLAETNISAAAEQGSFSVTAAFADCSWTAGSTNEWIHPTASTNAGPGDVAFLVDTNASIVARVGYIQVADQTFTVSQAAAPCAFTLSLAETNISAAAEQGSFSVTAAFADCSWTAGSTNEWIHPTASTNAGPGDVFFLVDTNASIVARVGYIQVADQTFTVSQAAAPYAFTLSIAAESSSLVLSWPTSLATLTLESTTNLGSDSLWAAVTNTPQSADGFTRVTIVPAQTQQFFRLHRQ